MKKMSLLFAMIFLLLIPQVVAAEDRQFIIVNKATNELAFYENGELVKTFPVGTGRQDSFTPEGTFPIVNKIKNRPYYSGGIPGGSPKNPLGDRWLGLQARGTYGTTYAIHGNNNPSSIGNYVSAGCIRMYNEDVHWLFDRVKEGTNVNIVNSSKSFDEIAKESGYQLTPPIKILLDGKEVPVDTEPFVQNNRILVPIRAISTAVGADVEWDPSTSGITITRKWDTIDLNINSNQAFINGEAHYLDVPPVVQQNRTLVPIRFVSEAFGLDVKWDHHNRTVLMTSPKPPERTPMDVTINGHYVKNGGFIEEGHSLVQVSIFSSLGVNPQWDGNTSTVTILYNDTTMVITSDKKEATFNEKIVPLPKPVVIVDGRFYLPAKTIADELDGTVQYDFSTNEIMLTLPEIAEEEIDEEKDENSLEEEALSENNDAEDTGNK